MRKILLLCTYFFMTPVFIGVLLLYQAYLSHHTNLNPLSLFENTPPVMFAALPSTENSFKGNIIGEEDVRVDAVTRFIDRYNPSLHPYARTIVSAADKYGIDYRLLPAIGMQESNLCRKTPKDSYNCWGFGIYGKKVTRFDSYGQAIDRVTKTLADNYVAGGLDTPYEIMKKYTPSNNGEWAKAVSIFMNQMDGAQVAGVSTISAELESPQTTTP